MTKTLIASRLAFSACLALSASYSMQQEDLSDHLTPLAYELKENIFSYLKAPELCSVACANQTMNDAVKGSTMWKEMITAAGLDEKPEGVSYMKYFLDNAPFKHIRISVLLPNEDNRPGKGQIQFKVNTKEFVIKPKYGKEPTRIVLTEDYPLCKAEYLEGIAFRYMVTNHNIVPVMSTADAFNYKDYEAFLDNHFKECFERWHRKTSVSKEEIFNHRKDLVSLRLNLSQGVDKGKIELGVKDVSA